MRQARSDATRRKIIDAGVELINTVGYAGIGLGDIIARAAVTKGAFYYHFDSKQALAEAVLTEGTALIRDGFLGPTQASAPALENLIHGVFVAAHLLSSNMLARASFHVAHALGGFDTAAARMHIGWLDGVTVQVRAAIEEGDVNDDLDPATVAETFVACGIGAQVITNARMQAEDDMIVRLVRIWELLLPSIATEASLPYFQQYLAREALRFRQRTPPEQ